MTSYAPLEVHEEAVIPRSSFFQNALQSYTAPLLIRKDVVHLATKLST